MPIDPIRKKNFQLFDSLKGGERLGVDEQGRLYVRKDDSSLTSLFNKHITADQQHLKDVALDYVTRVFSQKKFRSIDTESKNYRQLMSKLNSLGLFSKSDKQSVAFLFYNRRYRDLVVSGIDEAVAESIVTIEMSIDSYISMAYKVKTRPTPTNGGMSGSYFIRDREGKKIAVFKPQDEDSFMPNAPMPEHRRTYDPTAPERHQRRGQPQGIAWLKEVAAWEIDKGQFANVPFTTEITVPFPTQGSGSRPVYKRGSLQMFVAGKGAHELTDAEKDAIPAQQIQKMAAFDLLIGNGDRHEGNFMWDEASQTLSLIDHGLTFLDSLDWKEGWKFSEGRFEWSTYPQARDIVNPEVKAWILEYDLDAKCQILKKLGISERSIREHRLRVLFTQEGVRRGITLAMLASCCMPTKTQRSWLDTLVHSTHEETSDEEKFYVVYQKKAEEFFSKVLEQMQNP
ncbi:MAG: hypothetical protein KR126chlam2_00142 [Chlamydiae bacterium]|nr:hypothetical protein [Chlamydiota bacterium]